MRDVKKLTVKYNDRIVGYLAQTKKGIGFQYGEEWLKSGFNISPFSLPLTGDVYVNEKNTFGGLYGVFADSLPDGWGQLLVSRLLAKQGINYERLSPLTKLSLIGGEGLGGLSYEPTQAEMSVTEKINFDELAIKVKEILNDEYKGDLDEIYRLGGSSGGTRPKAHINIDDEPWIVKFPCHYDPINVGEGEYNANILAKRCGLNVNECKLFPSNICSGYFGAKRFDRIGNKRLHMISLSSVLETTHRVPNLDYFHLLQVTERICEDKEDVYEAFGRMCFNVLYGNKDDHGKNFAFLYDEKSDGYCLSPFYDITKTTKKPEHEMTVNGNGKPTVQDMLDVAEFSKLSITKCKDIIERIQSIIN